MNLLIFSPSPHREQKGCFENIIKEDLHLVSVSLDAYLATTKTASSGIEICRHASLWSYGLLQEVQQNMRTCLIEVEKCRERGRN